MIWPLLSPHSAPTTVSHMYLLAVGQAFPPQLHSSTLFTWLTAAWASSLAQVLQGAFPDLNPHSRLG